MDKTEMSNNQNSNLQINTLNSKNFSFNNSRSNTLANNQNTLTNQNILTNQNTFFPTSSSNKPNSLYINPKFKNKNLKTSESNLKTKLDDAYSDLENLRKAIKDIKSSNEGIRNRLNSGMGVMTITTNESDMESRDVKSDKYNTETDPGNMNTYMNKNTQSTLMSPVRPSSASKTPSRVNNKNSQKIQNAQDVINNFKEILKESEKYTNSNPNTNLNLQQTPQHIRFNSTNTGVVYDGVRTPMSPSCPMSPQSIHSGGLIFNSPCELENNQNNSVMNKLNTSNHQLNSFMQRISSNNLKDEVERLKISNQVLNKSNLDLKNQNRILQMELEALQGNNIYNFTNNLNFDQNLNNFIENLKVALNSSQMSNQELNNLIDGVQKKNADLMNENTLIKEQFELSKTNLETLNKRVSELKFNLEECMNENKGKDHDKTKLQIKLKEKEEKLIENNEKISNLISLNENYNKNKSDMNDMIENLKNTVEILKKGNGEIEKEREFFKNKIEDLQSELESKNYEYENLKGKIEDAEKEKEHMIIDIKNLKEEMKNKENYIQEIQYNYKNIISDVEKYRIKLDLVNQNLEEKDHTIDNLKTSLNFITQTLNDYKVDYEKLKNKNEQECQQKSKIQKSLEIDQKRIKDIQNIIDSLQYEKEVHLKKIFDLENDLSDIRNKFSQTQFQYEVLNQKYSDQCEMINKLKEENKQAKLNKITEDYSINFIKSHDDKLRKLSDLTEEIKFKTKENEEIKKNFEEKCTLKDDKIRELSLAINTQVNTNKDIIREMEVEIKKLKNENENLKKEVQKGKVINEKEKSEQTEEKAILQREYTKIANLYNKIEEQNKELASKNKILENNILELHYNQDRESNSNPKSIEKMVINSPKIKSGRNHNLPQSYSRVARNQVQGKNQNLKKSQLSKNLTHPKTQIFATYDNKRVLSFDIIEKKYKILTFDQNDTDFFDSYTSEGTITLNIKEGLFIVTGTNSDSFYFYNSKSNKMEKLQNLSYNHSNGALVQCKGNDNISIIALSGKMNKKVEKLTNSQNSKWINLPEMNYDRCSAGYIIINEKYLYAFFGYSYLSATYLPTIERLNLDQDYLGSHFGWEEIKYSNTLNTPTSLKSFFTLYNEKSDEILIFGGYEGKSYTDNKKVFTFDYFKNSISEGNNLKVPESFLSFNFSKESTPALLTDKNNSDYFVIYDDSYKAHIIDSETMQYDLFNFTY